MLKLSEPRFYSIAELARESGLESKSKVRYYLQEVLDEYIEKELGGIESQPRKTTLYPEPVLQRLKFIKKAKSELETVSGNRLTPSIQELRAWMSRITDEEVNAVLEGRDDIHFGVKKVEDNTRIIETLHGERLPADTKKYGNQIAASSADIEDGAPDTALDYIDQLNRDAPKAKSAADWQTMRFGPDLEIRFRATLTKKLEKELRMAGQLIRSLLSKEQ